MNENLKRLLITGVGILLLSSFGLATTANASHHVTGWYRFNRNINLKMNDKRVHFHKNQRLYIVKLIKNKKFARVKIGHKYCILSTRYLKHNRTYLQAIKRYKRNNKRVPRKHSRISKQKRNGNRLVRYTKNKIHHHKKTRKDKKILKSRVRRSNNSRTLSKSGFYDLRGFGSNIIMNKYAPNNKRAVVPKNVNFKGLRWLKGKFLQMNPSVYEYNYKSHGWINVTND